MGKLAMINFLLELVLEWGVQILIALVAVYNFNALNRKYPDFKLTLWLRRLLNHPKRLLSEKEHNVRTRTHPTLTAHFGPPRPEDVDELVLTVLCHPKDMNRIASLYHDSLGASNVIQIRFERMVEELYLGSTELPTQPRSETKLQSN